MSALPPDLSFLTSGGYLGTNLFLAWLCAMLSCVAFVLMVSSFADGGWKRFRFLVLGLVFVSQSLGYTIYSPTPFYWVQNIPKAWLGLTSTRYAFITTLLLSLVVHWISLFFQSKPGWWFPLPLLVIYLISVVTIWAAFMALLGLGVVAYDNLDILTLQNVEDASWYVVAGFTFLLGIASVILTVVLLRQFENISSKMGLWKTRLRLVLMVVFSIVVVACGGLSVASGAAKSLAPIDAWGVSVALELLVTIAKIILLCSIQMDTTVGSERKENMNHVNTRSQSANVSLTLDIDD